MSFNKCIMQGNLTRDVALTYLPSQTPVAEFGLAVNRKWKDKATNEAREEVCFIDVRAYGKQAEIVNQYFKKGQPILIEGRLQLDQWEGKDGTKRSKHRIALESFAFIGGKQDGAAPQATQASQPADEPPSGEDLPF